MIKIRCGRGCAKMMSPPELLTAGMNKVVQLELEFTEDWSGLRKTAVFTNGRTTVDVLEAQWSGRTVNVAPEVLAVAGRYAKVGVYGSNEDGVVLPTVWVTLGKVCPAAEPAGDQSTNPTMPVWRQIEDQIGNLADLSTSAKRNLVAAINEAARSGGGGMPYELGSTLKVADGVLDVNTSDAPEQDNTLPITSAAVYSTVGNIEALLSTI